jgi:hypothetical protein
MLEPGGYTVHATDATDRGGVVLVEVYAATSADQGPRLGALSVRGPVAPGADVLIAGIVLTGTTSRTLLLRGVGPGLSNFGVADVLSDPRVAIFDANGHPLAENDAWARLPATQAELAAAATAVGAFPLSSSSQDAALLIAIKPGSYTIQVAGPALAEGTALIEVYPLPVSP